MAAVGRSARAVAVVQLASIVAVLLSSPPAAAASCPQLESIVRSSVQAALQREIALAAGLIRIFFHDCFPQARTLIIYTSIYYLDSLAPAPESLVNELPGPGSSSVRQLINLFGSRGMGDAADLVALSGGHTVGRSQCGFVRPQDDSFSRKMAANCSADPNRKQDLDVITPVTFDNGYYMALTRSQGVFTSDMALIRDQATAPIVRRFAQDKAAFFAQFTKSMIKLSKVPRPGGNVGEIRRNCFRSNRPRLVDAAATFASEQEEGFAAFA
ncbi:hypothetical protein E2562_013889 [Oryza meyeriana var. granulata]|uniref:Plant heme peroxidase family profile domain-containing protein n=1 Tax=Oryza meyeriana var. granulata TaxID=110450 RepID=A0A6G1C701_9ORYZ|nr:hypothetical protein E2562_013889 [Oryza meyeriana var. granulata]